MKKNSLQSILSALVIFVACVMGCSKSATDAPKAGATRNANNGSANQTASNTTADIAGNYDLVGTNPSGSPYKGALEVIKRGDVYQFRWNAGKQYDGIGVPNGNVVAVAFTGGSDGKGCGVVTYKVIANGALDGKWGYWGLNDIGTEKAMHTSGSGLSGDYKVTGTNPDGTAYQAKLSV